MRIVRSMRSRVLLLPLLLPSLLAGLLVSQTSASAPAPALASKVRSEGSKTAAAMAFVPALPTEAVTRALFDDGVPQLEARLVVSSGPNPQIGVLFDLAPGWHLYWRNPGDTGIAPRLDFRAPGHGIGEIVWPAPRAFVEADGLFTTYGYEGRVLLGAPLVRSADPESQPAPHSASVTLEGEVLICRTECIPVSFTLSSPLDPALPEAQQTHIDAAFADARRRAPVPSASLGLEANARWSPSAGTAPEPRLLTLTIHTCPTATSVCPTAPSPADAPLFIPFDAEAFELSDVRLRSTAPVHGTFVLELAASPLDPLGGGSDRLHGLVPVRDPDGAIRHVEIDVAITIGTDHTNTSTNASTSWARILLLALLGGLILNGMPCVLPVLAVKIVAIADLAERNRREIQLQGLAYATGVLASMVLLASTVIGLRAAGHSVGWGFQFQEPLFVAGIAAVIVAFALNLFGVFEIELGQNRLASLGQDASGVRRSLFEGLLAVVLATPCTAPFLGTAVGFAFAASGLGIVSIFLAIGLGLASPFLAVSFFPSFARFIPRPGPWMLKLRAGLGFCLLATAVWLLWVLGQSGGAHAVVQTVAALVFLAFLLWIFGQVQPLRSVWIGRTSAATLLGLSIVGFNSIELEPLPPGAESRDGVDATTVHGAEEGWQPWSRTAVASALAAGRPSFVVFTADWCITCQVNERTVLEREEIRAALHAREYALFKADWTRRDETIRLELAKFGRAGVPLYLVYSPDAPTQPRVLSELLSQREVLAALGPSDPSPRL